ncbi:MAG: hypothetical protein KAR39_04410 [Thermoplasmata archaeon]|nr:hypothetical protein [Thermoplasmata archaeon]
MIKTNSRVGAMVIVALVMAMIGGTTNVLAESGTDTIHEDYYKAHSISFTSGESIEIWYTMRVTDGPNIDIYFVDSDNYRYYKDGRSFDYHVKMSEEGTSYESNDITLYEHDTYYLIFDNTNVGTDPPWNFHDDVAYVTWTIDYDIDYGTIWDSDDNGDSSSGLLILLGMIALIVIVVIVVVGVAVAVGKKSQPPQQQQYPPQQPPQYPPE